MKSLKEIFYELDILFYPLKKTNNKTKENFFALKIELTLKLQPTEGDLELAI